MSTALATQTMARVPAPLRAPQTQRAQERPAALPALTGIRFFAALGVLATHYAGALPLPGPLHRLAGNGSLGVNFFFILSGFILAYTYLGAGHQRRGSVRAFYVARLARCYPVYLLGLLVALPAYCAWHDAAATPVLTLLAGLLMQQAWLPWSAASWNAPAWSLSCEAFFYLLFPLLAPAIARLRTARLRRLGVAAWLLGLLAPLLYVLVRPDGPAVPAGGLGFWMLFVRMAPVLRLPEFVLGIALGVLFARRPPAPARPPQGGRLTLLVAGAVLVTLAALAPGSAWATLATNGLLDPLFCALIYLLARHRGLLATLLGRPSLVRLGDASYALYLLHVPLYWWLGQLLGARAAPGSVLFVTLYAALATALALLVYAALERPARSRVRALLTPRRAPPRSVSSPGAVALGS